MPVQVPDIPCRLRKLFVRQTALALLLLRHFHRLGDEMRTILHLLACIAIPTAAAHAQVDPYTAELARQADARIARQSQEANAQNNAIRTSNMNAGRCAQLAHDRQMLTWQLSQTGWELEQRSVRAQLQIVQSEMIRFGC